MLSIVVLNTAAGSCAAAVDSTRCKSSTAFSFLHVTLRPLNGKFWVHTSEPRATNAPSGVQQVILLCKGSWQVQALANTMSGVHQ